jgi:hypothetical protein
MADIPAASASYADVNTAVSAAANGDRVLVPAGSATWPSSLVISGKAIELIGAGIGSTVITDGVVRTGGLPRMISWDTIDGGLSRFSGFTINGGVEADGFNKGIIYITGSSHQFRMDHNAITPTAVTSGVQFDGDLRGVVDHNTITVDHAFGIYTFHNTWGGVGNYGDNSFAQPDSIGTVEALFVEDNQFINNQTVNFFNFAVDGWSGSRVVYRHNTFTNCVWDNHGTESGGRLRGARQLEVHDNTFIIDLQGNAFPSVIGLRSGTGVIYNNAVTATNGTLTRVADGVNYRNDPFEPFYIFGWAGKVTPVSITHSGTTATVTTTDRYGLASFHGYAYTDNYVQIAGANQAPYNGIFQVTGFTASTFTYTMASDPGATATGTLVVSSPWDGNTDAFGYRAIDQIGAGQCDLISGDVPVPTGNVHQALEPLYVWGNTLNGSASNFGIDQTNSPSVVVENRDYYNSARPGWSPYTYPHPLQGIIPLVPEHPGKGRHLKHYA